MIPVYRCRLMPRSRCHREIIFVICTKVFCLWITLLKFRAKTPKVSYIWMSRTSLFQFSPAGLTLTAVAAFSSLS